MNTQIVWEINQVIDNFFVCCEIEFKEMLLHNLVIIVVVVQLLFWSFFRILIEI